MRDVCCGVRLREVHPPKPTHPHLNLNLFRVTKLRVGVFRRVLVLRLGVWGLGVDAKSVRSIASVRKRSPCVRGVFASVRTKIVANAELSSLLDSRWVFAFQKCQHVVTFGLAFRLRVSTVSTVTGIEAVLVAQCRTVATFGLAFRLRLKRVNSHRVLVAKRRTVVTFGLAFGEERKERREGEERRKRRKERRGEERRGGGERRREERGEERRESELNLQTKKNPFPSRPGPFLSLKS